MPPLLSRIEREYIVHSLCTDLPELTVLAKEGAHVIREYHCDGKKITWMRQHCPEAPVTGAVKVFFSHKQRNLSFASELRNTEEGIVCPVSGEIYPENHAAAEGVRIFFPEFAGSRYAAYTGTRIRISRQNLTGEVLPEGYAALGEKAGLGQKEIPALMSLGSYLERVRSGDLRPPASHDRGSIVHCDHVNVLVVFPAGTIVPPAAGTGLPVRIHHDARVIVGIARCAAYFRVTATSELLVTRLEQLQEEDKRLLFEMNYTEKYEGNA